MFGTHNPSTCWAPGFYSEIAVHTARSRLYNALVESIENSRLIISHDPTTLGGQSVSGNPRCKRAFSDFIFWLSVVKKYSIDDRVYSTQFVEPLRCFARTRISLGEASSKWMNVEGLVVSVSRPFQDRYSGEELVELGVICPILRATMNIRIPASQGKGLSLGAHTLSQVQPYPLVNRLHPLDGKKTLSGSGGRIRVGELDFIKLSLNDLEDMGVSAALEDYITVRTTQKKSRVLSRLFVVAGKLVACSSNWITLKSVDDRFSVKMLMADRSLNGSGSDMGELCASLEGQFVRVLCSVPWCLRTKNAYPEALYIEGGSREEALLDDIKGFVRVRGRVKKADLEARYHEVDLLDEPLMTEGDCISYLFVSSASDPVADCFLSEQERLRSLRRKLIPVPDILVLRAEKLFSRDKLNINWLIKEFSADPDLANCLLSVLNSEKLPGGIPSRLTEAARQLECPESKLRWLWYVDLLTRRKVRGQKSRMSRRSVLAVSDTGLSVMSAIVGKRLADELREGCALIELSRASELTGLHEDSLLGVLRRAEEHPVEQLRYICEVAVGGEKTGLFWSTPQGAASGKIAEIAAKRLQEMRRDVLGVMRSVPHGLASGKVAERLSEQGLKYEVVTVNLILDNLAKEAKVSIDQNNVWVYPPRERVMDFLIENPDSSFTLDELSARLHVNSDEIERVLSDLVAQGEVETLPSGRYALKGCAERVLEKEARNYIEDCVVKILRRRGELNEQVLEGMVLEEMKSKESFKGLSKPQLVSHFSYVIEQLEKQGKVVRENGVCRCAEETRRR